MRKYLAAGLSLALIGCAQGVNSPPNDTSSDAAVEADVDSGVESGSTVVDSGFDGNFAYGSFDLANPETDPMIYSGGNVMTQPTNVYVIWYGAWTDTSTQPVVEELLSTIGGSSWFLMDTRYYQQPGFTPQDSGSPLPSKPVAKVKPHVIAQDAGSDAGIQDAAENDSNIADAGDATTGDGGPVYVSGVVNFIKSIKNNYSYGSNLSDDNILQIVADAITAKQLPLDSTGAYFVFTSSDVQESGYNGYFCNDYCGWHNSFTLQGQDIKYAFVGDVSQCYDGCSVRAEYTAYGITQSPNNDWPADGMISVIAHELSELCSDPDVLTNTAWTDDLGAECADKCSWTFGKPYLTKTGSIANVSIGSRDYMIQQNWVLDSNGGRCDLHL